MALSSVFILLSWVALCFCSLLPFVLFLSFLFNALYTGSSLFSALAQEREKRTIDALRLTQLSSLDILHYKSQNELKAWKFANAFFLVSTAGAAFWAKSPILWALAGAVSLACGGLLSIALALAVSTRCETTSSAVVSGWVTKGVWLAGLPIVDYVFEAVLVMNREFHLFSYLDPAWVYGTVVKALIFETSGTTLFAVCFGSAVSVAVAFLLVRQSGGLIDTSFESSATLDDRSRHSVYSRQFPFQLHKNPFMVRELAWQIRTGAGAWPGYAVFVTLFLAPFLYGLAQQGKVEERKPVKIVRESVSRPYTATTSDVFSVRKPSYNPQRLTLGTNGERGNVEHSRYHGHHCLSMIMGLPVPTTMPTVTDHRSWSRYKNRDERIVVKSNGSVSRVSTHVANSLSRTGPRRKRTISGASIIRKGVLCEL